MSERIFSESDLWYTPIEILELLLKQFPDGYQDPATDTHAMRATPYDLRPAEWNDHLDMLDWPLASDLPVYLNSPYSRKAGTTARFTNHLLDQLGTGQPAVVTTNASTASKWWQALAASSVSVLFPSPRIKFDQIVDGKRVSGESPRYDNSIFFVNCSPHDTWNDLGVIL